MNAFADGDDVNDLHVPHIGFGGDMFLEPGSERFAQEIAKDGEGQREGNEQESPTCRTRPLERDPGKGRGEKCSGDEVGSTSGMDGESAFARAQAGHGFVCRAANIIR